MCLLNYIEIRRNEVETAECEKGENGRENEYIAVCPIQGDSTNCAVAQLIMAAARLQARPGRGIDSRCFDPSVEFFTPPIKGNPLLSYPGRGNT